MREKELAIASGLTEQEAECWELAGTLANRLYDLPTLHEADWHDVVPALHLIQNKLLAQPAYRRYLQITGGQTTEPPTPVPDHKEPSP